MKFPLENYFSFYFEVINPSIHPSILQLLYFQCMKKIDKLSFYLWTKIRKTEKPVRDNKEGLLRERTKELITSWAFLFHPYFPSTFPSSLVRTLGLFYIFVMYSVIMVAPVHPSEMLKMVLSSVQLFWPKVEVTLPTKWSEAWQSCRVLHCTGRETFFQLRIYTGRLSLLS